MEKEKPTEKIDILIPHESNFEPYQILLNPDFKIYDILPEESGKKNMSHFFGLEFNRDEITRDNYNIDLIQYVTEHTPKSMTQEAAHILIYYLKKLKNEGKPFELHPGREGYKLFTVDGKKIHCHVIGLKGRINGNYSIFIVDQTTATELVMKLQKMVEDYEALSKKHEDLANIGIVAVGLAHDLKTPIGKVKTALGFIEEGVGDYQTNKMRAYKSLDRALRLCKETLQYLSTSKRRVLEKVKLSDLIADTVNELKYRDQSKKLSDKIKISELKEVTIIGDPVQLERVFSNIIGNAAEKEDADEIHILLSCENQDGVEYAVVNVVDNGIKPIEKDKISELFKPFYTTKTEGSGLGLAISYKVTKEHGGKIEVESIPEKTSFKVYLPLSDSVMQE